MAKAKEGIGWQTALIDIDRSTEFSGDDVDQYSGLVDLGRECSGVIIEVPALDAASTIKVYGQSDGETDTVPKVLQAKQPASAASHDWATSSGSGNIFVHCECLGAIRYIRLRTSGNQGADRSFKVLGTV